MALLTIVQITLFFLGTLLIVFVSRKSLRNLKHHGFYRFFVFEFTLALVSLNIPFWFMEPFSLRQIFSWMFLLVSLYLLYRSVILLKKVGGLIKREIESSNYNFENTANLVKEGIYKHIRHPMYGSLLFLCCGTLFKNISVITFLLTLLALVFLILTAKAEEKEDINFFGSSYLEYMKETKMFIPYIF